MLQWMWMAMVGGSVLYAVVNGCQSELLTWALEGANRAVELSIGLCAGYMFFCGLMEIVKVLKAVNGLERLIRPLMRRLMPGLKDAAEAVTLNLSMNVLGLGNAATPVGMEAMRQMEQERRLRPEVKHDMYMLLILNATSLQLLPTTVLTFRASAGSADVNAVIVPTLICSAVSTLTGALLGFLCRSWEQKGRGTAK